METKGNKLGNTKVSLVRGTPRIYWCFTWNNYTMETVETFLKIIKWECDWWVFQEEKGEGGYDNTEKEGTLHLQGILKLKKKERLAHLKKINPKIHWEPTRAINKSIAYCTKLNTRVGKVWSHGVEIPEEIELIEPYGWQLEILDIIKEKPDKRSIYWYWEPKGNVGKSEFTKYLYHKHNALTVGAKAADTNLMLKMNPKRRQLIIVDVPRRQFGYLNYPNLECIKNGHVISGKYESGIVSFNKPHVIVFANEEPDYEAMSADRWVVKRIIVN